MQIRSPSQGAKVGPFELHSQRCVVLLHVSAFLKQSVEFKHEQGGCPTSSVIFIQALPVSQGSNVGPLLEHSQVGGVVVLLQRLEVSEQ